MCRFEINNICFTGGIFHDCAVHDIDLTCWVLGEYPTHVFASATAFLPEVAAINDHDTVAFTMKFPSGALSMTDLSRNAAYGYDQRLEVSAACYLSCHWPFSPPQLGLQKFVALLT